MKRKLNGFLLNQFHIFFLICPISSRISCVNEYIWSYLWGRARCALHSHISCLTLFVIWLLVIMVLKCRHDITSKQVYCVRFLCCCFTGIIVCVCVRKPQTFNSISFSSFDSRFRSKPIVQ